jgi:hypothetical protein
MQYSNNLRTLEYLSLISEGSRTIASLHTAETVQKRKEKRSFDDSRNLIYKYVTEN